MMDNNINIDELLDAERGRKGPFTRSERDAMWSGVQRSIGVATAVAGTAAVVASTKAAATTSVAATTTTSASTKLATWKLMTLLSAVAIGGAGAGAAAHAKWSTPKVVTVEVSRPTSLPIAAPTDNASSTPSASATAITTTPTASATPRTTAAARVTPATPAASAAKDPSLARERTLLDMARTALSRGDAPGALASLDAHAREFPSSQLTEEREVLAIQALASSGRMPEARKRASSFRARFVNSPLRSIVDEATQ